MYRPIGLEWFTEGYWKIAEPYNNNIGTVKQFLEPGNTPTDGTPPLNQELSDCMTLEQFKNTDIDIVIASIPAHIQAYKKLIKDYKPSAKLIYHIGNIGWHMDIPWNDVDNMMASVKQFPIKENKNVVFYRQEFDLKIFQPYHLALIKSPSIRSFVNVLPELDTYYKLRDFLPEFEFRAYGASCPDGVLNTVEAIAINMNMSTYGYHNKPFGDGYGHIIHNWMAVGKPVIVNLGDYENKLAGELLEDGVTCFDIDKGVDFVANRIRNISKLEYVDMCTNVRERFKKIVDFEKDAMNVKEFLNKLI